MGIFRFVTTDKNDKDVRSYGDKEQAVRHCKRKAESGEECYVFKYVEAWKNDGEHKARKMK